MRIAARAVASSSIARREARGGVDRARGGGGGGGGGGGRRMATTTAMASSSFSSSSASASSSAPETVGSWTRAALTLAPKARGAYIMTTRVERALGEALRRCHTGVVVVTLRGSGANGCALTVNENADPDVRLDLMDAIDAIVGDVDGGGALDDAVRSMLVGTSLAIPVLGGSLALGTWQGLYLCAFADGESACECVVTLQDYGDEARARRGAIPAPGRGCHLVSQLPTPKCAAPKIGVATIFIQHTSASLTINENADPTVRVDLENAMNRIVPESWHETMFRHVEEGPDDMSAHVKTSLITPSVRVPISNGGFAMGTWQGVYLNEHRSVGGMGRGHTRDVVVAIDAPTSTVAQKTIHVSAGKRGLQDITGAIKGAFNADELRAVDVGTVHCFIKHTSASISLGAAGEDFEDAFECALNRVVPETWNDEFFKHTYEGPDDMPGHVKSTLVGASVDLPVIDGEIVVDEECRRVYLCEHRNVGGFGCGLTRSLTLTLQGASRDA